MALTTFLDRIAASQSPFVIFGDRFYSIEEGSSPDSAKLGRAQLALMPSMPFRTFEGLDERVYRADIVAACKAYVRKTVDRELRAGEEIGNERSRVKALDFIMFEFLPYLLSKKYSGEEVILEAFFRGEEEVREIGNKDRLVAKALDEITERLGHDFGDELVKDDNPGEALRKTTLRKEKAKVRTGPIVESRYTLREMGLKESELSESILGEITAHQPLYVNVNNGKVFFLGAVDRSRKADLVLTIRDRLYVPSSEVATVGGLSEELSARREQLWYIDALERSKDDFSVVRDVIKEKSIRQRWLIELARLKEYDMGSCGFVLNNDQYYAFSRIPKFATQDGRDPEVFWPYNATRVAIIIGWNEKPYTSSKPVVIEKRECHPCMYDRSRGFSDICNLNRDPDDYKNTTLDMVRKLSDAANVVMSPLNKTSLDSHRGHTYFGVHLDSILRQGSLTREQAREQGYLIVEVLPRGKRLDDE